MVMFLMQVGGRGQRATIEAIRAVTDNHGASGVAKDAVKVLNVRAATLQKRFWIWAFGQVRSIFHHDYQESQLCMWYSFFMKSRGLSWVGMEALADQGVVCGRRALNRWVAQQANAMHMFTR
jgi:hypothetical protein